MEERKKEEWEDLSLFLSFSLSLFLSLCVCVYGCVCVHVVWINSAVRDKDGTRAGELQQGDRALPKRDRGLYVWGSEKGWSFGLIRIRGLEKICLISISLACELFSVCESTEIPSPLQTPTSYLLLHPLSLANGGWGSCGGWAQAARLLCNTNIFHTRPFWPNLSLLSPLSHLSLFFLPFSPRLPQERMGITKSWDSSSLSCSCSLLLSIALSCSNTHPCTPPLSRAARAQHLLHSHWRDAVEARGGWGGAAWHL